jgi:hypothetical protein
MIYFKTEYDDTPDTIPVLGGCNGDVNCKKCAMKMCKKEVVDVPVEMVENVHVDVLKDRISDDLFSKLKKRTGTKQTKHGKGLREI